MKGNLATVHESRGEEPQMYIACVVVAFSLLLCKTGSFSWTTRSFGTDRTRDRSAGKSMERVERLFTERHWRRRRKPLVNCLRER